MSQQEERRKFLIRGLQGLGVAIMGGLIWSAHVDEAISAPLVLRPPAAKDEHDFLKTCIKCGLCVEACPFDTLKLASPGENAPLGTPYFKPREIPCYMCEDVPCVPPCPTGALDITSITKDGSSSPEDMDINRSQMGLAVVDKKSCIAYWGIQCDACYRACPLLDEAIKLEYQRNNRTGKHSYLLPIVDSDICTGCGLCERACVTEKAAIYILPREIAMGRVGSNYIIGWEEEDENRLEGVSTDVETETELSKQDTMNYLNTEDLLND